MQVVPCRWCGKRAFNTFDSLCGVCWLKDNEEEWMLYEYECTECEELTEALRNVANRKHSPRCEKCGKKMKLAISVPASPVFNSARPVKKAHNA